MLPECLVDEVKPRLARSLVYFSNAIKIKEGKIALERLEK